MALRRRCPGLCDAVYTLPSSGPKATLELGEQQRRADRRAICCLTYARNADAALLSHAHIISKAPHYCTTKAPHR